MSIPLTEPTPPTPFVFDEPPTTVRASDEPAWPQPEIRQQPDLISLQRIERAVTAAGETAYHWTIENDQIAWSANCAEVLDCDPANLGTGRNFASFLDPDNFTSRYDTVMRTPLIDDGNGVPFKIEYLFRPDGRGSRTSIWVEDHGRWYSGTDGRPVEVYGTVRRIDERHRRDQHLSFLGNCDPLTGMMNRGRMAEALGEAMTVAARDGTTCALMIAAINNLAVVNEAYGFDVADEVIVNMGKRLRQVVRTGDAIARYSGAKFGIILNQCGDEELNTAAERFLGVARESVIETERGPVWALLTIGALILPKHASDATTAMALAEDALSEARRQPSDGYVIYKPSPQRATNRKLNARSATEIVRCLREDRFRLAFQPIVAAKSGTPVFHEALLRMQDSTGEIIAAAHLIPIAEKLGLVRLIDRAVVQMATATLHKYPDARLSINLSGTTATDPRWHPQIIDILTSNTSVINRLIVEITETVALGDLKEVQRFVERLHDLGCSVAIDDFGAGYTSFRHLRELPVDILKLDGTFCRDLENNSDNRYFVRSLIDLARTFNLQTVAEWVENPLDADMLREWQVDFFQGTLFGEASLELPWQEAAKPEAFVPEQAPAVLPSEIAWRELEEASPSQQPPAAETIATFETGLSRELDSLRAAIAALDAAFAQKPRAPAPAEPSYADLISDSASRAAG